MFLQRLSFPDPQSYFGYKFKLPCTFIRLWRKFQRCVRHPSSFNHKDLVYTRLMQETANQDWCEEEFHMELIRHPLIHYNRIGLKMNCFVGWECNGYSYRLHSSSPIASTLKDSLLLGNKSYSIIIPKCIF